jgi:hypothetical protein
MRFGLEVGMFVNEPMKSRTVDHERHVELRYINSGPERPKTFCLTVNGTPIGFEVESRDSRTADDRPALAWRVLSVGKGHTSFSGSVLHQIPGYSFADDADRAAICSLIDEALRAYSNYYGMSAAPVTEVIFPFDKQRG